MNLMIQSYDRCHLAQAAEAAAASAAQRYLGERIAVKQPVFEFDIIDKAYQNHIIDIIDISLYVFTCHQEFSMNCWPSQHL